MIMKRKLEERREIKEQNGRSQQSFPHAPKRRHPPPAPFPCRVHVKMSTKCHTLKMKTPIISL